MPTVRAVIQRGILIREQLIIESDNSGKNIKVGYIARKLAPLLLARWQKANAKFYPPVIIQEKSLVTKVERTWKKVEEVALGRVKQAEKQKVENMLDTLFEITTCNHTIRLCSEPDSDCQDRTSCAVKALKCSCPHTSKVPAMELRWLAAQRTKRGEKSDMMMGSED